MAKLPIAVPARPSIEGDFTWFAYASSLDAAAFTAWCGQHGYVLPDLSTARPGRLEGFRLSFDVPSRFWGGAVATLVEASGSAVEGLLIPLPAAGRTLVDHKEGAVSGLYEPFPVLVAPLASGTAVAALAYRANPSRRLPAEATPSREFLETLIRGARAVGLSESYVKSLELARAQHGW